MRFKGFKSFRISLTRETAPAGTPLERALKARQIQYSSQPSPDGSRTDLIVNSNGSNIYVRIGVPTKSDTFISDAESMVLNAQGYNVVNLSEWEVANQTAQAISKIIGGI